MSVGEFGQASGEVLCRQALGGYPSLGAAQAKKRKQVGNAVYETRPLLRLFSTTAFEGFCSPMHHYTDIIE